MNFLFDKKKINGMEKRSNFPQGIISGFTISMACVIVYLDQTNPCWNPLPKIFLFIKFRRKYLPILLSLQFNMYQKILNEVNHSNFN